LRIFHLHTAAPPTKTPMQGRRIRISGIVQGVGFRPWVYRIAQESAVRGRVRNDSAGVTIEAFGTADALDGFLERLEDTATLPAAASVERVETESIGYEPAPDFAIVASAPTDDCRVSIPPDLATCPQCLAEVHDPGNRRYGYAFTNCTNCGPRFTIVRTTPYDRPGTTMAAFAMCPACQREYDDVGGSTLSRMPVPPAVRGWMCARRTADRS
jgi:hydrogenase maturation protein HypF